MWVGEGGDILGAVTIGGCVDAYVIEQAEAVLADQVPRLIALPLGDEDAWELGLSCAGTIEVFIEPCSAENSQPFDLYTALKSHLDKGGSGALLTCLDGPSMGAKLLLLDDGTTRVAWRSGAGSGSLPGGAVPYGAGAVAHPVPGAAAHDSAGLRGGPYTAGYAHYRRSQPRGHVAGAARPACWFSYDRDR